MRKYLFTILFLLVPVFAWSAEAYDAKKFVVWSSDWATSTVLDDDLITTLSSWAAVATEAELEALIADVTVAPKIFTSLDTTFGPTGWDADTYTSHSADAVYQKVGGLILQKLIENGASSIVVFNDDGTTVDLQIKGLTEDNLFYVDASTDRIGIGTATPGDKLHVYGSEASVILQETGPTPTTIIMFNSGTGATATDGLFFGINPLGQTNLNVRENQATSHLLLSTSNTERLRIEATGTTTFNDPGNDFDVIFETDGTTDTLVIDGGSDFVRTNGDLGVMGAPSGSYELEVTGISYSSGAVWGETFGKNDDPASYINFPSDDNMGLVVGGQELLEGIERTSHQLIDIEKGFVRSTDTWNITTNTATFDSNYISTVLIQGDGNYDLISTPTISDGTRVGQMLRIYNNGVAVAFGFQDETDLAGSNLRLDGSTTKTLSQRDNMELMWDGADWSQCSPLVDN